MSFFLRHYLLMILFHPAWKPTSLSTSPPSTTLLPMSGDIPFNHKFVTMFKIVKISAEIYCNKNSESRLQVQRVAKSCALPIQTARLSPGFLQILPYIPSPAQCFHRFGKKCHYEKGHRLLHINIILHTRASEILNRLKHPKGKTWAY